MGGHDEREQTLNQLLVELDGFDPSVGVILLAATNRPEILDPALLRAGRFDRQVLVDRPSRAGRLEILRVHAKKIVLAPGVDLDPVAGLTVGLRRCGPRQRGQRSGAGRDAAQGRCGDPGRFHTGDRAHRRRHREEDARAQLAASARWSPTMRWAMR